MVVLPVHSIFLPLFTQPWSLSVSPSLPSLLSSFLPHSNLSLFLSHLPSPSLPLSLYILPPTYVCHQFPVAGLPSLYKYKSNKSMPNFLSTFYLHPLIKTLIIKILLFNFSEEYKITYKSYDPILKTIKHGWSKVGFIRYHILHQAKKKNSCLGMLSCFCHCQDLMQTSVTLSLHSKSDQNPSKYWDRDYCVLWSVCSMEEMKMRVHMKSVIIWRSTVF